jgi:hypothetical protein
MDPHVGGSLGLVDDARSGLDRDDRQSLRLGHAGFGGRRRARAGQDQQRSPHRHLDPVSAMPGTMQPARETGMSRT